VNPLATLRRHGLRGTSTLYWSELCYRLARFRTKSVEIYRNPTAEEYLLIENELLSMGMSIRELDVSSSGYLSFLQKFPFPSDYHGGMNTGYWHEKIFEHYVSYVLLEMNSYGPNDSYLDVAAGGSPWARILRDTQGIDAYAIDLVIRPQVRGLSYYREEDATCTSFSASSMRGISLHCAYEMFGGDSDMRAIDEFSRILKPGGSVIIVPLYLHTHYCCYSSPECWGKGYADSGAKEYVRRDSRNIPTSRKYDPLRLKERVLNRAVRAGLEPCIYQLRGQQDISPEIYCHFVLAFRKPS